MFTTSAILTPPEELDKISNLPDDILLKFLSILDFKNSVQTSILGKRWRYLWTWRTDLDFDSAILSPENHRWFINYEKGPQGYLNWVNQVVDAHRGPCISKFRVIFYSGWGKDISEVEKWTRFAFTKGVEELDLDLLYETYGRFCLGFNILKHSSVSGLANLKSLSLACVDISGEALEFIVLQCHLLEWLYVSNSKTLHALNIVSYKLKHLTLISCFNLKELEIDAVNLISFHFHDMYSHGHTHAHIAFKSVPELIEVDIAWKRSLYPFPILEQISYLSKQLTKLSIGPCTEEYSCIEIFRTRAAIGVLFPNVKQLSLIASQYYYMFIEPFMKGCPMLQEIKLQVTFRSFGRPEAKLLQNIELEDEGNSKMPNSYFESRKARVYKNKPSYPNLKVLEIVGFCGSDDDVYWAMYIIDCANSFETFICDPRVPSLIGLYREFDNEEKFYTVKRRAGKLATLLPPKINVGVWDESGFCWVSSK